MTKLSVNLNKVALLRNQRDVGYPGVLEAARRVIAAGAHGITVHPRPDERHIRRRDVLELAALLANEHLGGIEFNVEGNPYEPIYAVVDEVRPTQATLVPDAADARTSDSGWDLRVGADRLRPVIARLRDQGIRVSLFVDPDPATIARAAEIGADRVELYTGPYAAAFGTAEAVATLGRYITAAEAARAAGLGVNAGHDLNLDNLATLRNAIPWLEEVSIGHAITADALWMGFEAAVRAYLAALAAA